MKSVAEIAQKLGITTQAIYKRKQTDPDLARRIQAGSHKQGKRVLLDDDAIQAIMDAFQKAETKQDTRADDDTTVMQSLVDTLRDQLKQKDDQIKTLQQLLNNQQQLTMHQQMLLEAPKAKRRWFWQKDTP